MFCGIFEFEFFEVGIGLVGGEGDLKFSQVLKKWPQSSRTHWSWHYEEGMGPKI